MPHSLQTKVGVCSACGQEWRKRSSCGPKGVKKFNRRRQEGEPLLCKSCRGPLVKRNEPTQGFCQMQEKGSHCRFPLQHNGRHYFKQGSNKWFSSGETNG